MSKDRDRYTQLALRTEADAANMALLGRLGSAARLNHVTLGLASEVGEFADAAKTHIYYGKALDRVNLMEEAGDILWYLAILCDICGCTFEQLQEMNINKLSARFPEKFNDVDAMNRDLEKERAILEGGAA